MKETKGKAENLIWEQQPKESAKAFAAAQLYFEQGAERSLESVAQKLGKSKTIIARWSGLHGWSLRAKAYDEHLRRIEQAAIEKTAAQGAVDWQKERNRIRMDALRNSKLLVRKAIAMLSYPLVRKVIRDGRTIIEPAKWTMADAVKFVEAADKLQRLAAEMETSKDTLNVVIDDEKARAFIETYMSQTGHSEEKAKEQWAAVAPLMSKLVM